MTFKIKILNEILGFFTKSNKKRIFRAFKNSIFDLQTKKIEIFFLYFSNEILMLLQPIIDLEPIENAKIVKYVNQVNIIVILNVDSDLPNISLYFMCIY